MDACKRFQGTYRTCTNWHWGNTYAILAAVWLEAVRCEFATISVKRLRFELEMCLRLDMRLGDGGLLMVSGFQPQKEKGTHTCKPTQKCGRTRIHLPHRAMTKSGRLPNPCWHSAAIGNIGPCPVWLAGQCAVCPGGLKSQGLAAAAATDHSHLNSFPILTPGSTQSAASLGHSTTSS